MLHVLLEETSGDMGAVRRVAAARIDADQGLLQLDTLALGCVPGHQSPGVLHNNAVFLDMARP